MISDMRQVNRRELIGGGLLLGAGLLLGGCQAGKKKWKPLTAEELSGPPNRPVPSPRRPQPSTLAVAGVIPRREWTSAGPILALVNPMGSVDRITVHHSAVIASSINSKADTARMLESIRRGHTAQQWADIGYHYIIDPQGRVWEGRPVKYQGAHVKENNERNLGIMCLGNFDVERPSSDALTTLDAFVADRMRAYRVPISRVFTHQEIRTTECPGRHLQHHMVATRSNRGRLAMA
jgi:hypothetical protein